MRWLIATLIFPYRYLHHGGVVFPEKKTPWKVLTCRPLAVSVVILLFILLSWRTSIQLQVWQNDETLFRHALKMTKGNYLAHSGLGAYLAHHGNDDEALRHLKLSVAIRPDYAPAWFKMGVIYSSQGLYRAAAMVSTDKKRIPRACG